MFGKSNLVKCVISFVSVCFLSPSGSSDRGTGLPALGSLCLWLTLRRKTHSRGPSPWLRCKKKGSGGFRSLHGFLQMQKQLRSYPWPQVAGLWPPFPRSGSALLPDKQGGPASSAASMLPGRPSYPDHLPAGRLPASSWALPGSALGMVPSFLLRS